MVGAVARLSVFAEETALSLYPKKFFLDRYFHPALAPLLVPEIVEERTIASNNESVGYNRLGQMNRNATKGVFVDSYC